ncbi:hypothetical protein [Parafilimonas sp.]|uniref:hypothetical protein n=1 Tax=Parafilimonas sp. TaxID=1969739 RepID=UPI0039E3B027
MDDLNQMSDDEKLRAENDFLKMKLMLEHGAQFRNIENDKNDLPPEIENQFLNNVMAFENQFAEEYKTIKVFDKIGRPQHFKPVAEITDEDMEQTWEALRNYLNKHDIDLDVCSPNIPARELYRFATEELFEHEMDDMSLSGWSTNFIYDEFHPDPIYDNSRMVKDDLIGDIFCKEELFWDIHYAKDGFSFNAVLYNEFKDYSEKLNRFKSLFNEIELKECTINGCTVNESDCYVTGNYKALAQSANNKTVFSGNLRVKLLQDDLGYWNIKEIEIKGFDIE